ncbi:Tyrosine recombinase XerD [Stieleria neptunia]|uniref:Tyrosine recombinase XerD n=1 Tax=Stieleria neptunia TaxID=2527979 RepID=A0A518HSU6_9BACT|nr:tyrosine-type recombinase/integrase [Stieleria neptunia]QDV43929.1 Tyrosine recombinase XerD [Stieleria neptunia]
MTTKGELVVMPEDLESGLTPGRIDVPRDLSSSARVAGFLSELIPAVGHSDAAAVLVPWFCDVVKSPHSRRAYGRDLAEFVFQMGELGIHPLHVTGDEIRIYKEALRRGGLRKSTIARKLSVLRGVFEQFGKRGYIDWETVGDIQSVSSDSVDKNTTPALSEKEAKAMLHAPNIETVQGLRDYAMLFTYFITACRASAVANAKVSDLERTETNWYLVVTEKREKTERKSLLEAAEAIHAWLERSKLVENAPLFPALERDRVTPTGRHLSSRQVLNLVKKYARSAGIQVERVGRGVCSHSLRKTALTNALNHGAKMEQVQALAGHADIRTTQLYYENKESDAEDAARHIQIR